MIDRRWWWCGVAAVWMVVGCASGPSQQADGEPTLDDCVSERGQRLLTFCASPDAARLAERQHTIEQSADDEDEEAQQLVALPTEGAPVRGEPDAPVTIHLFSDLRCSDCRVVYRRLAAEVDHRPGQMRLVFRHTPLDEAGENLARAAAAAGEQGKFWEFVDELYSHEQLPSEQQWPEVAESAGLDVETWQQDRRLPTIDALLEQDGLQAEEVGVVEAPTFFVNGIRKVGGVALQEFDEVAEQELNEVEAMQQAGLGGADISWRRILHNYQPVDWEQVEQAREQLQQQLGVAHVPVNESPRRGAGDNESLVTVVMFADFLCQYCAESAREWQRLVDQFADQGLRLVFKHFPLPMHDGSERLAAASVIAQQGGVFWEFHDEVFAGEPTTDTGELQQLLEQHGWRGGDFNALLEDPDIQGAVGVDRRLGEQLGVEGTPTMFINGIRLEGVWSAEELAPLVEDQIELAETVAELTGNAGEQLYRDVVEANKD